MTYLKGFWGVLVLFFISSPVRAEVVCPTYLTRWIDVGANPSSFTRVGTLPAQATPFPIDTLASTTTGNGRLYCRNQGNVAPLWVTWQRKGLHKCTSNYPKGVFNCLEGRIECPKVTIKTSATGWTGISYTSTNVGWDIYREDLTGAGTIYSQTASCSYNVNLPLGGVYMYKPTNETYFSTAWYGRRTFRSQTEMCSTFAVQQCRHLSAPNYGYCASHAASECLSWDYSGVQEPNPMTIVPWL